MRNMIKDKRPLSPHLTVYRPQNTSVLSIFHRLTGIGLVFPTAIIVIWLICIPLGPFYFNLVTFILESFIGEIFLTVSLWALISYLNEIRHLIWDLGIGITLNGWTYLVGS